MENKQKVIIGIVKESLQSNEFVKKMEKIMQVNCTEILVVKMGKDNDLTNLFEKITTDEKVVDELVVNDLSEFGLGIVKFWEYVNPLLEKGVKIVSISEELTITDDSEFTRATRILYGMHRKVLSESSKQGQLRAEERGFKPGRPNLSEELIKEIRSLRRLNKYSLREIADICGVSVGTVFKYAKD